MWLLVVSRYSKSQKLIEVKDNAVEILETAANELLKIEDQDCDFGILGFPYGTVYVLPSKDSDEKQAIAVIEDDYDEYDYFSWFKVRMQDSEFYYTIHEVCSEVSEGQIGLIASDGIDASLDSVFPFSKPRIPESLEEISELYKKLIDALDKDLIDVKKETIFLEERKETVILGD